MKLKAKDFLFVGVQFVLFIAYIFTPNIINISTYKVVSYVGLFIAIIGFFITLIALLQLNTNLSPFPTPKSNSSLITNGIYKFIRHPIYTGIILITFGYGLHTDSLYRMIISMLLYILFYFKSSYEEERLKITFSDYDSYKTKSGRFFPKL